MTDRIIEPPTWEPVTLDQAKAHCKIDDNEFDALLDIFIGAARSRAESETGRALCTQTRELVLDAWPEACVLRGAPIQSLVSAKYIDVDGNEQTIDPQDLLLDADSAPGYLLSGVGKGWPATAAVPNAVRVRYICGYPSADAVPKDIKTWMLLAIGSLFAQRESFGEAQYTALPDRFWQAFLDPYRIYEAV